MTALTVPNETYLERAFAWFNSQPTRATHKGGFFTVVHRATGIAVTRRDYREAVCDLYHECQRRTGQ